MTKVGDKILIIKKHGTFNGQGLMDRYLGKILTVTSGGKHAGAKGWTWDEDCYINVTDLLQSNITEKEIINQLFGKGE